MKKKGLIISTIVMVVVLIASLTTATYAWFTSQATATISSMNIQTSAAQGLQIASVVYNESASPSTYNGNLSLNSTSKKWVAASANGYGSELTLTPSSGQYLLPAMYGTSGDGTAEKMFIQHETDKLPSTSNPMELGAENVNYVALDFSLLATSAGWAFINQIYVDPTSFGAKSGMAGSMRLALFATAPAAPLTTGAPTWSISTHGKMLYIPYAMQYDGVGFSGTEANNYYTAAGTSGTSIGTLSEESLQTTWTAAKTVYGTTATINSKELPAVGNDGGSEQDSTPLYANLAAANAVIKNTTNTPEGIASLGYMNANQVIYLRLVIWFEGESKACVQEFSGGGAQVKINFSMDTTVPAPTQP